MSVQPSSRTRATRWRCLCEPVGGRISNSVRENPSVALHLPVCAAKFTEEGGEVEVSVRAQMRTDGKCHRGKSAIEHDLCAPEEGV